MNEFEDYNNNKDNNNERRSKHRIFDNSNMLRTIQSQKHTEEMDMCLMAQIIALRKKIEKII